MTEMASFHDLVNEATPHSQQHVCHCLCLGSDLMPAHRYPSCEVLHERQSHTSPEEWSVGEREEASWSTSMSRPFPPGDFVSNRYRQISYI